MNWKKLGLVYVARGDSHWAASHAYVPTSVVFGEDRIRVYVAFIDRAKTGRVGFVDLDAKDPLKVLRVSDRPALNIGEPGTFDDSGVTPLSLVQQADKLYLYYIGWQLGVKVRYFLFVGLAVSQDGGETFARLSRTPILERSDQELFVRSAANVVFDNGLWRMWYIAGDEWVDNNGKKVPTYNIRYLESENGVKWNSEGLVCLDLESEDEFGFGRPYVVKDGNCFKMWYSIRTYSKGYRLGYAESPDGKVWVRMDDQVGIDVSPAGWDSEMICCACIQKTRYGTYMFYNGNNYGETGFGVAVLK